MAIISYDSTKIKIHEVNKKYILEFGKIFVTECINM